MIVDEFDNFKRHCRIRIKIDDPEEAELLMNELLASSSHEKFLPLVDVFRLTARTLVATQDQKPD